MKSKQEQARDAYAAQALTVLRTLEELQAWADTLHDAEPESVNWGHVGSLEHINSELRDVLRFARNEEE